MNRKTVSGIVLTLFCLVSSVVFTVVPVSSVVVPNTPPDADAGPDQTVEQTTYAGADVTLDGSGSTDDGLLEPLTYTWTWNGGSTTGLSPTVQFPLGTTTVTLTVYDGEFYDSDTVAVTVVDTTPPTVTIIYPPDGAEFWVSETIEPVVTVYDICDPSPSIDVTPSWSIPPPLPPGDLTITAWSTDASGNTGSDVVTVVVLTPVSVDIKPGSWPNPIKTKNRGVLPVAICGTADFDVMTVDPETVQLHSEDVEEGIPPLRWSWEDVATPYTADWDGGHDLEGDGFMDLVLHFDIQEAVMTLTVKDHVGETLPLMLRGNLFEEYDGARILGQDYVQIR